MRQGGQEEERTDPVTAPACSDSLSRRPPPAPAFLGRGREPLQQNRHPGHTTYAPTYPTAQPMNHTFY